MKKLIVTFFLLLLWAVIYFYHKNITDYIMYDIIYKNDFFYSPPNEYKKINSFKYVKEVSDFNPKDKQDIINIIYTGLNNGWENFTFFCHLDEYEDCLDDVEEVTNDKVLMSNLNNYLSTYNSFNKVIVNINNFGRVNINVYKLYSDNDIAILDERVEEIYDELISDNMSDVEKIKAIHDYIINNTRYDNDRSEEIKNDTYINIYHHSNMAFGPLIDGKAICGGYTDAMALFLDKMHLENYKVSGEKHIWNLVYVNGEWKHLDLTWDDPVVNTGEDMLLDSFFLVDSKTLLEKDSTQHTFDETVFIEAK